MRLGLTHHKLKGRTKNDPCYEGNKFATAIPIFLMNASVFHRISYENAKTRKSDMISHYKMKYRDAGGRNPIHSEIPFINNK